MTLKLRLHPRPTIIARVTPRLSGITIEAGAGIDVDLSGNVYTISAPYVLAIPVTAFGAVGAASDHVTFQAAFDYGIANGIPIYIPAGNYAFTSGLTITDKLTVFGAGRGALASVLVPATDVNLITINTDLPVHLSDFKIIYPAAATGTAIILTSSNTMSVKSTIERLWIESPNIGISVDNGYGFTIRDIYFNSHRSYGMVVQSFFNSDFGDSTVENCTFTQPPGSIGIEHRNSGGLRVINNKFIGGLYGYWSRLTSLFFSSVIIANNSIEVAADNSYAILFSKEPGTSTNTITNVVVTGNQLGSGNGIGVIVDPDVASRKWLSNLTVVGNTWYGANPAGNAIFANLDGVQTFTVQANTLRSTTSPAFPYSVGAGCDNGIVEPNTYPSTFSAGAIHGSATNIVNGPLLPSYTVSTLPSVSPAARLIYVSNETGGAVVAFSDGANWRRVTDRAVVS